MLVNLQRQRVSLLPLVPLSRDRRAGHVDRGSVPANVAAVSLRNRAPEITSGPAAAVGQEAVGDGDGSGPAAGRWCPG